MTSIAKLTAEIGQLSVAIRRQTQVNNHVAQSIVRIDQKLDKQRRRASDKLNELQDEQRAHKDQIVLISETATMVSETTAAIDHALEQLTQHVSQLEQEQ